MLTKLDDYPRHQVASTFDHVVSSDYRWFDRYWFCCYDPSGSVALVTGLGVYNNMNVLDGFGCVIHEEKQHCVRVSRQLRPDIDHIGAGPLRYEVLEPLQQFRLVMGDNDYGMGFDLVWRGNFQAHEEGHHFSRRMGRIVEDYRRFDQLGRVTGQIRVAGKTFTNPPEGFFGVRDRSWGIRPGVGGPEPPNGPPQMQGSGWPPNLFLWMAFQFQHCGGYFQLHENAEEVRSYLDGTVRFPQDAGKEAIHIVDVEHEIEFFPGTRRIRNGRVVFKGANGESWDIHARRLCPPWVMEGLGYFAGYNDGLGLGVYRGELLVEGNVYDVSDPQKAVDLNTGKETIPAYREQPAVLECRGERGMAHFPCAVFGPYPRYGFK